MSQRPRITIQSPERVRSPDLEEVIEEDEEEVMPMHHMVLYDLLGEDKAESILNPKIEEEPKRKQSIYPTAGSKLSMLPSIDTGMGAEAIWRVLKDKSDRRINRLERRIPQDWKRAYGSFLRDRLSQNKSLLFRSFTGQTDVPDLDVLKKHDYVHKVRKMRNHTNVMYRSSEHNHNHTTLLLNNNPAPSCSKSMNDISLERYFNQDLLRRNSMPLQRIEYPLPPAKLPPPKNLHFLTNEGAKCKGTFYAKYADEETVKMVTDVPGYKVKLPPSMTARYTISAPVHQPSYARQWRKDEKMLTAPKKVTPWEPLTCGALMEYAPVKPILGSGDFKHGRFLQWRNTASAGI